MSQSSELQPTTEETPVNVHALTVLVCQDCIDLKGVMCNNAECVFCRRTMVEVQQLLDAMLLCPIVDGKRLILVGDAVTNEDTHLSPASTAPVVDNDDLISRAAAKAAMCNMCANPDRYKPAEPLEGSMRLFHFQRSDNWNAGQCLAQPINAIPAAATAAPRSNHFPNEALNRGFPDHISRDGTAYYGDGTVLPSAAPVEQSAGYTEISCAGCGRDTDTKLLLCPTCVDSGHEGAR